MILTFCRKFNLQLFLRTATRHDLVPNSGRQYRTSKSDILFDLRIPQRLLRSKYMAHQSAASFNIVTYHYPCIDGIFAALAAYLGLREHGHSARFVPMTVYKDLVVSDLALKGDETVYMLDYSGPQGFAIKVAEHCTRVVILDHHKTAAEHLADSATHPPNLEVTMDMERSGATIALDYFKPTVSEDLHRMFRYVEDGDLWRWQLPDSRAFYAGMKTLNLHFDASDSTDIFDLLQRLKPDDIIEKGKAAMGDVQQLIKSVLQTAFPVQLGGAQGQPHGWGSCLAVEVDRIVAAHRSQLGNELAQLSQRQGMAPAALVCYYEEGMEEEGRIKVSLRSLDDFDTTPIAQHFGGGGHKNASSFNMPVAQFEAWKMPAIQSSAPSAEAVAQLHADNRQVDKHSHDQ